MKFRSIVEYLERSAALYPDKAVFASDEASITYAEFVEAARRVGAQLPEKMWTKIRRDWLRRPPR